MKYVSDAIDFERDIEPYRVIQVYAGVGAGKNTWIEGLVREDRRVLLITSRKITADAQADKMSAFRRIDLDNIQKSVAEGNNRAVVITNAGVEKYVKTKYNSEDCTTHLWRYFDIVVVDEAHSIAADAVFSDAPFHVMALIVAIINNSNCKIVLMTGTPEPLNGLINASFKKEAIYNNVDIYNECHHVKPNEVILYNDRNRLWKYMGDQINNRKRVVYFANTIDSIFKLVENLKDRGVDERRIGVSFSDAKKKEQFSEIIIKNKERVERALIEEEKIPNDIFLLATTSKNKEGINILNEDIGSIVAETTERTALIQMAGRVRRGVDRLIVLYDAQQYVLDTLVEFEEVFHKRCLDKINKESSEYIEAHSIDPKINIINRIEEHFPYARYDYFRERFELYKSKIYEVKQVRSDNEKMKESVAQYLRTGSTLNLPIREWFPESKISLIFAQTHEQSEMMFREKVSEYLKKENYLDRDISKEERNLILPAILKIAGEYSCTGFEINLNAKSLNPILKKAGYKCDEVNHHNNMFRVKEIKK